jgi:hypothetical protein
METKSVTERLEDATAFFIKKHGIEPSDVFIGYLTEFELIEELSPYSPDFRPTSLEGLRLKGLLVHVLKNRPVALWVGAVAAGSVVV